MTIREKIIKKLMEIYQPREVTARQVYIEQYKWVQNGDNTPTVRIAENGAR